MSSEEWDNEAAENISRRISYGGIERCRIMPSFIHFFGADGTGKTTQGQMLVMYMRKKGIDAKLVRIRSGRTFASILYSFFKKVTPNLVVLGGDKRVLRIRSIRGRFGRTTWSLIEFGSMLPWLIRGVFVPISRGKTVVAERYIIDAIATIAFMIDDPSWEKSCLARVMLDFIPRNSAFIHLDASYRTIASRKGLSVDPRGYLEFQRGTYLRFAKATGAITIDTSKHSLLETHKLIYDFVDL
jgi:hypothetical protein